MDTATTHLDLLGYRAEDKITGFKGVVDSISFDLYGCIQASLRPPMDSKGEIPTGHWFDLTRLDVDPTARVIEAPNFEEGYIAEGKKGPAEKPLGKN